MKNILLVHGFNGVPKVFYWLKENLKEYEVIIPEFPPREGVVYENWYSIMEKYKSKINKDTIVVAHSIGNEFIIKYLYENNINIDLYIGLAGFSKVFSCEGKDVLNRALEKFVVNEKEIIKFRKDLTNTRYAIYSDNDHIVPFKVLEEYSKDINATGVLIPGIGHMGKKSGVESIKEILDIISEEKMNNQKKYKTILFDIDDTLIDFDIDQKTAFKEAVKKIGYVCNDKMYEDYNKINLSMWEELNLGKMTLNDVFVNRFSVFFKKYGIKYDELEFNKILTDMFQKTGTLIKGVKETLDKLVNNYELAVISNGPKDQQYHRLKNADISKYFSKFFISEEIGYNKPDKRFFDIVFKNIDNKEKSKILIVGDSITSDIIGGKQVGVDTCLYNIRNKENKTNIKPEYEIENFEELLQIL